MKGASKFDKFLTYILREEVLITTFNFVTLNLGRELRVQHGSFVRSGRVKESVSFLLVLTDSVRILLKWNALSMSKKSEKTRKQSPLKRYYLVSKED